MNIDQALEKLSLSLFSSICVVLHVVDDGNAFLIGLVVVVNFHSGLWMVCNWAMENGNQPWFTGFQ